MKNLPVIVGIAAISCFAHDLPICEEFAGEPHIQCVATDEAAVIITRFDDDSSQYEYYTKSGKKGFIYLNGGVVANTSKHRLQVASIPADDADEYIREVFNMVMDDINWQHN